MFFVVPVFNVNTMSIQCPLLQENWSSLHPDRERSMLESCELHLESFVMSHTKVPIAKDENDAEEVAFTNLLLTFLISQTLYEKLYLMTDFPLPT